MQKTRAVEFFGGPTKLARLLGISRQAIYQWPEVVPDLYQYKLHHLSGGELEIDAIDAAQRSLAPGVSPCQ